MYFVPLVNLLILQHVVAVAHSFTAQLVVGLQQSYILQDFRKKYVKYYFKINLHRNTESGNIIIL